ncbi:MAG TPA: molecular chaperone TorD family protein [Longimicrobiales bacterium]|nr:molecular chaperone TorD family protein [Longimicrobiales bacterium]
MELLRTLGVLAEAPGPAQARLAAAAGLPAPPDDAAHTELFRFQLPPYASIYLGSRGMLGGEARDRIAGFWRALQATPPPEPDHLATLLAAHASLVERDAAAGGASPWRAARHAFFWEHLASWLVPYLARIVELGEPFHRAWARALEAALAAEAALLGPPTAPPAHFAAAPPVAADSAEALLDAVLAPARSGVILTRRDLQAGARRLEVGLRQGERRFALTWMLRQDPRGTLAWLAEEAARQAAAGSLSWSPPGFITAHWQDRARETARILGGAAREAPSPDQEVVHA